MSIYAIADLHLALDERIDKPMDVFGDGWHDHVHRIEENWKATVSPEDTVIVAGDISWGLRLDEAMADLQFVASLPGHKVLVKGNHDLWWNSISQLNALDDSMTFLQNSCYEVEGWYICGSRGWVCPGSSDFADEDEKLFRRETGRIQNSLQAALSQGAENIIAVTHYPPTNEKKQGSDITKLFTEAGVKYAVYGHLHGKENAKRGITGIFNEVRYECVALDQRDCKLLQLV